MSEPKNPPAFEAPRPGPEHEILQKDVGTWDAAVEIRFPGVPAQLSEGEATNRLICGGLWLVSDFRNQTTGFEGHGVYGYDPAKKKYVGTWVDPMRTFLVVAEGTWDPATRTLTMSTEATGPGGKPMRWRELTTTVDADTLRWRQLVPMPDGSEHEMMIVTYRRRK